MVTARPAIDYPSHVPLPSPRADVIVVGLGPAGRALAHRAAHSGLRTIAVDPRPRRLWPNTYGLWVDELPEWLGTHVLREHITEPHVWTMRDRALPRAYGILDNRALQDALDLSDVQVVPGSAFAITAGSTTVRTPGGEQSRQLFARVVIDARGIRRAPGRAEQSAYGITMPRSDAHSAIPKNATWFMDWRADHDAPRDTAPSFLYAVPAGPDHVLLEETCLVGRPALPLTELRARLQRRLRNRGVDVPDDAHAERVHFAVEPGVALAAPLGVPGFGARGGLTHPGTGFSVAASLNAVDPLVDALIEGTDPMSALWPRRARAVRRLRTIGLDALLDLPAHRTAEFFDAFFDLPVAEQQSFLSARADLTGTAHAMWGVFRRVRPGVRWTLAKAAL
ncbi:MAG: lycopene cyclase family protein [Rhodococcus sp.]|nr:lycopene cyclase family protein [Rhodococcus sp. (in: high G+C Gram-positive bacteria)]